MLSYKKKDSEELQVSEKPIYVIGHKNPDTDSIMAAIAYANLKNKLCGEELYIPRRAGHTNPETKYVLKRFGIDKPKWLDTLEPRISDVSMRKTDGVDEETSLKRAWEKMKNENLHTLPVFRNGKMVGLITQGDIARSMMEEHENTTLSSSRVSCRNIIDTLDGELVVGDINAVFSEGTIAIGASGPSVMLQHIKPHSMVIMGNRLDAQISAIEQGADWFILSLGSEVSDSIKQLAKAHHINIIVTPYNTYRCARLINQSMPTRHVMHTGEITGFHEQDFVREAKKVMTKKRLRYFPVYDKDDNFTGLISQRNLLDLERQKVILVDHNEKEQCIDGIDCADILEIIDHHRVGGIETPNPVTFRCQPLGCTCTIIAQMYKENRVEITPKMAAVMLSAILSDTLCFKSPTCTPLDEATARELAAIAGVNTEELASEMFTAGSDFGTKNEEEIFYQDFKAFSIEGFVVGVSQVTVMKQEVMNDLKNRMKPFVKEILNRTHLDVAIMMVTDIMNENSVAIFASSNKNLDIADIISDAFGVKTEDQVAVLPGVVSRKKQMMPTLTYAIQNR